MPLASCATRPGLSAASVAGTVSAEEEPGRVGAIAGRGSLSGAWTWTYARLRSLDGSMRKAAEGDCVGGATP